MLTRCSIVTRRTFSKHFLQTQWKRADPNRYWRAQHNLPPNDEDHGPLAHLPDYSYLNGEPSRFSAKQQANYDFNASIVRRIHELDHELTQAKKLFADKVASTMADYEKTVTVAEQIKTPSRSAAATTKKGDNLSSGLKPRPSIKYSNEYSLQPQLLNALREEKTYNEAFAEVVDPVGEIVPEKLMSIERPPYKRTGERRRYQKIFRLRTPTLRMFPR